MTHDATADATPARAPRNSTLSIKSLILLMLLAVSIGSNLVVGIIGYVNGTDSLKAAAFDRLVEVRDSRAREVTSLFDSIQNSLLVAGLLKDGSEDQKSRFLPELIAGRTIGAFALTEADAGSDAAAVRTRAVKVDGGWRLDLHAR